MRQDGEMAGFPRSLKPVRRRLRLGLAVAAALLAAAPLQIQAQDDEDWADYSYPEARFAIRFPAKPEAGSGSYPAALADGSTVAVPATVHAATRGTTRYQVSIADFAGTRARDPQALNHAVAALRRTGSVALETRVSMANSSCGYYLGLTEPDGALSFLALFYDHDAGKFYDVRARVPASDQELRMASAVHFQQSISFLPDPAAEAETQPSDYPDGWREYDFLDQSGFAIRFPAEPRVETGTYRTAGGITVPAARYWVQQGDVLYKLTAATYWETAADTIDAGEAIDPAIELIAETGTIASDVSIGLRNAQCGRELRVEGNDGSRSDLSLFFPSSQHRLFILETRRTGPAARTTEEGTDWFRKSFRLAVPQE